nr:MAG: CRISPR-associated protein Cas6 [Vulcanisaeta sp. AZ3]
MSALVLSNFTGSIAMSMTLNILGRVDDELARSLHELRVPKPISVTPFAYGDDVLWGRRRIIAPGEVVRFRVSALDRVGSRLVEAFSNLRVVRLFNVDVVFDPVSVEVFDIDGFFNAGPGEFVLEFLSPVRFARRRTMRRRRVKYDFCPSMENIVRSGVVYWNRVVGDSRFKNWVRFLRWVYNYVYVSDFYGRVVSTRLPNSSQPQLGFIGRVRFEIKSKSESRIAQLWGLLRFVELMNVGTTRSLGFGYVRIKTDTHKPSPQ